MKLLGEPPETAPRWEGGLGAIWGLSLAFIMLCALLGLAGSGWLPAQIVAGIALLLTTLYQTVQWVRYRWRRR